MKAKFNFQVMAKQIILKWRDVIETKVKFFLEKLNCFRRYSGCLPFTKIIREIRLENKKEHDFLGLPNGKFPRATENLKR